MLNDRLSQIPNEPGCYLMLDINGTILYVGKSKKLRNRVRSYFHQSNILSPRIRLMVKKIYDIEFIVTDSESEALTLESNLIKNNQPYFNVLLKDDKKYPYVCITWSEEYPRIFITRKRRRRNQDDRYYGPFVDVGLLRKTLVLVKRVFPMRQRPIPLYKDRTCLNYQIGRCPGVCQKKVSSEQYKIIIQNVAMIFQGRSDELTKALIKRMNSYSERLEYEKAAQIRDQIKGLEQLQEDQKMILPDSSISRDVVAMASDGRIAAIQIFQMRSGKLVGRLGYTADASKKENNFILETIIEEHYSQVDSVEIPREILLQYKPFQYEILTEWLTQIKGKSVKLIIPKRNIKADFIDLVERNANYELSRIKNTQEKHDLSMEDLASLLEMDNLPRRIEGYDISHIQGSDAVGSQVVFIDGLPAKQHYRKYKIKNQDIKLGHSDDFLSLEEVITRRFRKWAKVKSELGTIESIKDQRVSMLDTGGLGDWPDLIMIDGGKGQLSTVMKALRNLDLDNELTVCSLAKKNEKVYVPGKADHLSTEPDQLGVVLLRRLRDEAHRFAVSFHRQRRGERMKRSSLQEIPGVGPKRIRELLLHFQSIDSIQHASIDDLTKTPGLGKEIALQVWTYFHKEDDSNS